MRKPTIKLNKPFWGKDEEKAVLDAIRNGLGTGEGPWSLKAQKLLREYQKVKYAYLSTSCTHALECAVMALGVKEGDEVILPSFTMTSTANCVVLRGAACVFADIENDTFCMDSEKIEKLINKKTKAIIVVHYAGIPARMDKIMKIAKKQNLSVIEDAAHDMGTRWSGRALGTLGDIGCYSFHGTKNISCGEGGAIVTNNKNLAEKIETIRANGTNRSQFLRGEIDKYSWVGPGSSYYISDILAAILTKQLEKVEKIISLRSKIATKYMDFFNGFPRILKRPAYAKSIRPNWHIFALKFHDRVNAFAFQQGMRKKGIEVSYHYVPLHLSEFGAKFVRKGQKLPVTEEVAETLIRLPIYPDLANSEINSIISAAGKVLSRIQ